MMIAMRLVGIVAIAWAASVAVTAPADAKRMIRRDPPVVRNCSNGPSWDAIATCLRGLGRFTILQDIEHAKVVRVELAGGKTFSYTGTYLYAKATAGWQLSGELERNDAAKYELLEDLTLNGHRGFHLKEHSTQPIAAFKEDQTFELGLIVQRHEVFCPGAGGYCTPITTACDVMFDGNARWSFRGELKLTKNEVDIIGDRSHVQSYCSVPEHVYIGWPSG
jgi:hypothetical protein